MTDIAVHHAESEAAIAACFPAMQALRPHLTSERELIERVMRQQAQGYRLLAAWRGDQATALAGYRMQDNLIRGRFVYVDDLVALPSERRAGLGRLLLDEVARIGTDQRCGALVLDTGLDNVLAHRFYYRSGLLAVALRFARTLP